MKKHLAAALLLIVSVTLIPAVPALTKRTPANVKGVPLTQQEGYAVSGENTAEKAGKEHDQSESLQKVFHFYSIFW